MKVDLSAIAYTYMCTVADCGQLSNPANGQVHTSASTVYNSKATYSCDTGYMLSEEVSRICQANETWSGSQPECLRKLGCVLLILLGWTMKVPP